MFNRLAPFDHACIVYHDDAELLDLIDDFTQDGLDHDRLTLFVHAFPTDADALQYLTNGKVPYKDLLGDEFFLVSYYKHALQGDGPRIDHEHVARVVQDLEERARAKGRLMGIFVAASHKYIASGRAEEWFRFEEWLGLRLQNALGLVCAYRESEVSDPATKARMLKTHLYRFQ